jgi:hypothetical protein
MGENAKESNVKTTVEIVSALVKEVPVYQDALQPAAKQVGKSLETITKTINIALAPVKALVWGYERIEQWLNRRLGEKLADVPEENIVSPPPNIAGPALEALRYIGYDDQLRELYANLLAAAMNTATAPEAHPGYVEILKNLSSDEAWLLQAFAAVSYFPVIHIRGRSKENGFTLYKRFHTHIPGLAVRHPQLLAAYLDNLIRLGILESPPGERLRDDALYIPIETDTGLEPLLEDILAKDEQIEFERAMIRLTSFGGQFVTHVIARSGFV